MKESNEVLRTIWMLFAGFLVCDALYIITNWGHVSFYAILLPLMFLLSIKKNYNRYK